MSALTALIATRRLFERGAPLGRRDGDFFDVAVIGRSSLLRHCGVHPDQQRDYCRLRVETHSARHDAAPLFFHWATGCATAA
ncbi:MAG: hypothetical protein WDN69_15775 [Aliidongia sp.]